MQKKISDISLIVLFSAGIAFFLLHLLLAEDPVVSFYENRDLAQAPKLTAESVWDGSFGKDFESWLCDHSPQRDSVLKLKTAADISIFHRPVVNDIVVKDDILLPFNSYKAASTDKQIKRLGIFAQNLNDINTKVKEYGGAFVFSAVPSQAVYYSDLYPSYLNKRDDITDVVMPFLRDYIKRNDIAFADMSKVAEELGKPDYMSSKTDHHYSLKGAVTTWRTIIDKVYESSGIEIFFPQDSEIEYTQYPNQYLGSRNRKIMGLRYNDEKLLRANFKNDVAFERFNNGEKSVPLLYAEPEDSSSPLSYTLYMGGDFGNTVIKTYRENLPNVLIYGASFTNAVEAIAYIGCNELHSIDLRHYSEMSVLEYIEKYKPDVVVGIFDWSNLAGLEENGKY